MNHQDHTKNENHTRRVVLPSGKTIEVVYFDALDAIEGNQRGFGAETTDLTHCEHCDSNLVYPLDWSEAADDRWDVELRCPNCEWRANGVYDQHVVDRFDMDLDRGTVTLMEDLHALARANMEEEIERFVAALGGDHLLPEDF